LRSLRRPKRRVSPFGCHCVKLALSGLTYLDRTCGDFMAVFKNCATFTCVGKQIVGPSQSRWPQPSPQGRNLRCRHLIYWEGWTAGGYSQTLPPSAFGQQVLRLYSRMITSLSGAIVPVPCCEETLDIVQHETVVIRLGEGGSLLADVASLFGGCRDCSGQNNLSVGQMGSHPTR
jgi:hypothetical protein